MIKKLVIIFASSILILGCKTTDYTPLFSEKWSMVNDSIKQQWTQNSGNCTRESWSKSIPLPDTFAFATWCGIMFYWDSYFTQAGLISHDKIKLAKGGVNNLLFLVDTLGFVPNSSMEWGMKRSQPPYLSLMVVELYPFVKDTVWLRKAYRTLLKEYYFWTDCSDSAKEFNCTSISGLQRFFHQQNDSSSAIAMYNHLMERIHTLPDTTESVKAMIGSHFLAEAESGMDFTTRFEHRCADFIAVDLNANLYQYEVNFAMMEKELGISDGSIWNKKAEQRKELLNTYCWNEERGLFLDYDYVNKRHSKVFAATAYSPMLAGMVSDERAKRLVKNLLLLESEWGIITTENSGETQAYQWDHQSIWPPMQSLVIKALDRYGYKNDAKRIAAKYLDLVTKNFYEPSPATFKSRKKDSAEENRPLFRVYEKYAVGGIINNREYSAGQSYGWSTGTFAYAFDYIVKNK